VRPIHEEFSLYQVVNVPFAFEDSICTLTHTPAFLAASKNRVIPIQGMELKLCEPEDGLCFASQFNSDPAMGSACAEKIITTAFVNELKEVCAFECKKKPNGTNFVTQLDLHSFVITNVPRETYLFCQLEDETTKELLPQVTTGALELLIPCNCWVKMPGRTQPIRSPYPCSRAPFEKPIVHSIIPMMWSKIDTILLREDHTLGLDAEAYSNTFSNISICLNESWSLGSPTLNLTEIEDLTKVKIPEIVHDSDL